MVLLLAGVNFFLLIMVFILLAIKNAVERLGESQHTQHAAALPAGQPVAAHPAQDDTAYVALAIAAALKR